MPQLERFEPLSLAVEMAACFWPGTWGDPGDVLPWWSAVGLAAPAPTSTGIPSKNEIWSANVADLVHHAAKFGMSTGPVAVDMAKVRQRKRTMVERLIEMHLQRYKASGAELIMGEGRFVAPKTLEVQLNDGGTRLPGFPQSRNTCGNSGHSRPRCCCAAHQYRGAGTRSFARAFDRARRRICGP